MIEKQKLEMLNTLMDEELNIKQFENLMYAFIWEKFLSILLSKKEIEYFNLNIPLIGTLSVSLKKGFKDNLYVDKENIDFKLDDYIKFNLQSVVNNEIPELLQQQLEKKLDKAIKKDNKKIL